MEHLGPILADFILGELPPSELECWDLHLAGCERCARLVETMESSFSGAIPCEEAAPRLLEWVLAQVANGFARFEPFVPDIATLFDLSAAEAEALLRRIDVDTAWRPASDGLLVLPVRAGPQRRPSRACLLRLAGGMSLEEHLHEGFEDVFVLQGGYRANDGHEVWRGDRDRSTPGSAHSLRALDGVECICAVVQEGAR